MTQENQENRIPRQPVVAIVGHVDHGKTTLLDYIRKANVAAKEAGGITQTVGAYEIEHQTSNTEQTKCVTFIDTPGHEAFITMRTRGAHIADLAILVVAADEGVKPQTKESIRILEETKTTFIVAINKIDKPGADIERVKQDLATANVLVEGYGGQVSFQAISAKTGEGVNDLLDLILLTAELEELSYNPKTTAEGFVLESRLTKNRGIEATLIIKEGALKSGMQIGTESAKGKVKILENFLGKPVSELHAGQPAVIIGFESLPKAGELFVSGEEAVSGIKTRTIAAKEQRVISDKKTLNLILKAADAGSLEALSGIVHALEHENPIVVVDESVGEIGENDVRLAISTHSSIIGFKTKIDASANAAAQTQNISIITSEIIYELVRAIQEFLEKLKSPPPLGELEVLAVFNQAKREKQLVGGKVISGIIKNKAPFELHRADVKIAQGRIINLQEGKKDATQVVEGKECGLIVNAGEDIKVGDRLVVRT